MLCKDTLILLTALQGLWIHVSFQTLFSKDFNYILGHLWSHGLQVGHSWGICWNMEVNPILTVKVIKLHWIVSSLQCSAVLRAIRAPKNTFWIVFHNLTLQAVLFGLYYIGLPLQESYRRWNLKDHFSTSKPIFCSVRKEYDWQSYLLERVAIGITESELLLSEYCTGFGWDRVKFLHSTFMGLCCGFVQETVLLVRTDAAWHTQSTDITSQSNIKANFRTRKVYFTFHNSAATGWCGGLSPYMPSTASLQNCIRIKPVVFWVTESLIWKEYIWSEIQHL